MNRSFSVPGLEVFLQSYFSGVWGREIGKGVGASRIHIVLRKGNCTPQFIYVDVETHVEPCNPISLANQVRMNLFLSQHSIEKKPPRPMIKVTQTAMERKSRKRICQAVMTPS